MSRFIALLAFASVVAVVGCDHGPQMSEVTGVVTIDGNPVQKGSISFEPTDGHGFTAGATIEDGAYVAKVPPGEKRVRITGFEVVGQAPAYPNIPNSRMNDIVKDIVPPRYNSKSELKLTVEKSATTGNFDLKSS